MRKLAIARKITNKESNSFAKYLADISEIEMFSPEEEYECGLKAFSGDEAAIQELARRNLRFVVSVAKQYSNSCTFVEDLVNEGNIGLLIAARKFDPSKGFKFISFSVWWIRKIITQYLDSNSRLVRLPSNKVASLSKFTQKVDVLEQHLGRIPDITEIIEACVTDKIDEDDIRSVDLINRTTFDSFDRELSSSTEGSICLGDTIQGEDYEPTDHLLNQETIKTNIKKYLNLLKPRNRDVMISLFGLNGNAELSSKEIGDELGITREMVRQIKVKSLAVLQKAMKRHPMDV